MPAYEIHPLAAVLPALGNVEFNELVEDIKANGMQHPIVLWEGKILDGRNRAAAAALLNIPLKTVQFDPKTYGCSAEEFVISMNLVRRHLTPSQKSALAHEFMEKMKVAKHKMRGALAQAPGAGGWEDITQGALTGSPSRQVGPGRALTKNSIHHGPTRRRTLVAAKFGVSEGMIDAAKRLKEKSKTHFEAVKAGKVTVMQALEKAERGSAECKSALVKIGDALGDKARRWVSEHLKSKDAIVFGNLSDDEIKKLWPLIESGEAVSAALKYREGDLTPAHTIKELIAAARLARGSVTVGEFTIWVAHESELSGDFENPA